MYTCPWCGTTHSSFQPNCQNCGGPLPNPGSAPASENPLPVPPPAPRPVPGNYAWKLMITDGWAIAALVFAILGITFFPLGLAFTPWAVTSFVGIPFLMLGILFLIAAISVGRWRYIEARTVVRVLQVGQAVEGQVLQVEPNYNVTVNGRNPWTIRYAFEVGGQPYEGQVSTLNSPSSALQPNARAYILYLPDQPERNTLYPHP